MPSSKIDDVEIEILCTEHEVNTIKQAAKLIGIHYHDYIKIVVFRQSLEDIIKSKQLI